MAVATAVAAVLAVSVNAMSLPATHTMSARAACPGATSNGTAGRQAVTLRCLVNWARDRNGAPYVSASPALQRAAYRKAINVIRCKRLSHRACGKPPSSTVRAAGYDIRTWGENLYIGEGDDGTPLAAIEAWLRSPSHRAVLLGRGFAHVGVAVVPAARLAGGTSSLWVLELGATL